MKTAVVRARIEPALKRDAEAVLHDAGLELSDAIRLFLRQVVQHGGLPFGIHAAPGVPVARASALEAPKRAQQRAERARRASRARLFIAPEKAAAARVTWPDADYDR